MIDIHSHLLPGIDDGPRTWDAAVDLCRAMADQGIELAVATPHLIDGIYNNVRRIVEPLVDELNSRLRAEEIGLTVLAGAEVDLASRLVTPVTDEVPLLGGAKSILLEMPVAVVPHAMADIIFSVRSQGIVPVLAHPERNELVQAKVSLAKEWVDAGAVLQIDGDSLLDVWGRRCKSSAVELMSRGLCSALASDAHSCDKRPPRLREAVEKAIELVGPDAVALVTTGPDYILRGDPPPPNLCRVDFHVRSARKGPRRKRPPLLQRFFDGSR